MTAAWRGAAGVLLAWAAWTVQAQPSPSPLPALVVTEVAALAHDNLAAADHRATQALAAAQTGHQPAQGFWAALALADVALAGGQHQRAQRVLATAERLWAQLPAPALREQAHLQLRQLQAQPPLPARQPAAYAALRQQVSELNDTPLACALTQADTVALLAAVSVEEATLSAADLLACRRAMTSSLDQAWALGLVAQAQAARSQEPGDAAGAQARLQAARALLTRQPASRLHVQLLTLRGALGDQPALVQQALYAAHKSGHTLEAGQARLVLAAQHLARHEAGAALPLLRAARQDLAAVDEPDTWARWHALMLRTLTALNHASLSQALGEAQAADSDAVQPALRRALAQARAAAHARRDDPLGAYTALSQARTLEPEARALARDWQLTRLQARYDTAREQAELAALRQTQDSAGAQLSADAARRQTLGLVVLALVLWLLAGLWLTHRLLSTRRRLTDLSLRDELTDAPNRRAITAYAQEQIVQAQRLGVPMALALIDLDHFKRVNDTWGHDGGDAALQAFALVATEVLGGQDRLGRWGGEEWLLVMPGRKRDDVQAVFERLRTAFGAQAVTGLPTPHGLTFSMGVALLDSGRTHLDALVAIADQRLYRAKTDGRDRCVAAD
ncbi:MAG: GGDEF domain-containing protein [Proteobacteria bacterium]|nr:GGDEF domain-containing protein [Pseudomonadota bacterium]